MELLKKLMKSSILKQMMKKYGISEEDLEDNVDVLSEVADLLDDVDEGNKELVLELLSEICAGMEGHHPPATQNDFNKRYYGDLKDLCSMLAEDLTVTPYGQDLASDLDEMMNNLMKEPYTVEDRKNILTSLRGRVLRFYRRRKI